MQVLMLHYLSLLLLQGLMVLTTSKPNGRGMVPVTSRRLTLRLPSNYPPHRPLITLGLLRPRTYPPGYVYVEKKEGDGRPGRRRRHLQGFDESGVPLPVPELRNNNKGIFNLAVDWDTNTVTISLTRELKPEDYKAVNDKTDKADVLKLELCLAPGTCRRRRRDAIDCIDEDEDSEDGREEDVLPIRFLIANHGNGNCKNVAKEWMCRFPPRGELSLRQRENLKPGLLFSLPNLDCTHPSIKYNITMEYDKPYYGPPELTIDKKTFTISTTHSLDRERRDGERLPFTITCTIEDKIFTHPASLSILDENDNPPELMHAREVKEVINIEETEWAVMGDSIDDKLMIFDKDLKDTNNFRVALLDKTGKTIVKQGFVTLATITDHQVPKNKLRNYEHTLKLNASCTMLTPMMKFDEDLKSRERQLDFNITTTDESYVGSDSKMVWYDVTIELSSGNVDPTNMPFGGFHEPIQIDQQHVTFNVLKGSPAFTRLGSFLTSPHSGPSFTLSKNSINRGIGITPKQGIVYLTKHEDDSWPSQLTVIRNGTEHTLSLLSLEHKLTGACSEPQVDNSEQSCASVEFEFECQNLCGVGAGEGGCSWRKGSGQAVTKDYATCSPNLKTCPDGTCDELEQRNPHLCPQDCINNTMVQLPQTSNLLLCKSGQGICKGLGVCSCTPKCLCFNNLDVKPPCYDKDCTPGTARQDVTRTPTDGLNAGCDGSCQVGVGVSVCLAFILCILALFCYVRKRGGMPGKYKGSGISLGAMASDYVDERSSSMASAPVHEAHVMALHGVHQPSPRPHSHNPLSLTADMPHLNIMIDSKWEFPRSRLVIEQTLGEGEFGKVMKARALSINSLPGYTTVAVKMLKSNSTPAELGDLLSEYSLLKEVSHPNVVKLLGACTSKGGPIYVIMEYCHFGSLRNYLRRSRHAEFEDRVGSGPEEGTAGDYNVSPRDLISFAWQICKGMSYLTDMKLVHRDLAARNVLLAAEKQCKISDFGLTRDVYEADLYFKRSKGRVPVKWMALESLQDHVYTSKSDVWSFGILLWELVTLGSSPYPGIAPERLFNLLKAGHRMERPENCSRDLYDVMIQCWAEEACRRPGFQRLTDVFESMIQSEVEYLELRSLIVTNRGYFDLMPEPPSQFRDNGGPIHDIVSPGLDDENYDSSSGVTDANSYLIARNQAPRRVEASEVLLSQPINTNSLPPLDFSPTAPPITPPTSHHQQHNIPRVHIHSANNLSPRLSPREFPVTHAHNPAYSPVSETIPPPLHYTTLAHREDEEDVNTQEGCRSEEDSDNSGRATGDSGYMTEDSRVNRQRKNAFKTLDDVHTIDQNGESSALSTPHGGSYSPLPHNDEDEDQDTSEDLEEKQELLREDILGHMTPSPEPNAGNRINSDISHLNNHRHINKMRQHSNKRMHSHNTPVIV